MDPVTNAIITAAFAGLAGGVSAVGKESIVDAYTALKGHIKKKFGEGLEKTIKELEIKPDSKGCQMALKEEIEKNKVDKNEEITQAAQHLLELVAGLRKTDSTFAMKAKNIKGAVQAKKIDNLTQNF